jgi:hypothetical protein
MDREINSWDDRVIIKWELESVGVFLDDEPDHEQDNEPGEPGYCTAVAPTLRIGTDCTDATDCRTDATEPQTTSARYVRQNR